jgi:hypothetical protein
LISGSVPCNPGVNPIVLDIAVEYFPPKSPHGKCQIGFTGRSRYHPASEQRFFPSQRAYDKLLANFIGFAAIAICLK